MKSLLRDFAIALSLANLWFYPVWARLLPGAYGHYYLKNPPTPPTNAGAMLAVGLSASIFWIAFRFARRSGSARVLLLARLTFLVVFLLALNGIRYHYHMQFSPAAPWLDTFWRMLLVLAALGALFLGRRVIRYALTVSLILFPFAAVTLSQATWTIFKSQMGIPFSEFSDKPTAALLPTNPGGRRVIWFLFDGLDQLIAFSDRPAEVNLPNLDRFRSEAVYAPYAYSSAGSTLLSIPALLTGRPIDQARPLRADELRIRFSDTQQQAKWSTQPNVFSRVRDLGLNTALVGYHHPYGRVLAKDLVACVWVADRWDSLEMDNPAVSIPEAAFCLTVTSAGAFYYSLPFVWRFKGFSELETLLQRRGRLPARLTEHIQNYQIVLEEAKRVSVDPTFQMVFVHWPVPHHPYIYEQARGEFSREKETSYVDNLILTDQALGEIRSAMEKAGVWDDTVVLITADHGYGRDPYTSSRRGHVPFLLKLSHQREMVICPTPFFTLLIPDLILALLQEKRTDPDFVLTWIERTPWKKSPSS